jgi:hypothetical protein
MSETFSRCIALLLLDGRLPLERIGRHVDGDPLGRVGPPVVRARPFLPSRLDRLAPVAPPQEGDDDQRG